MPTNLATKLCFRCKSGMLLLSNNFKDFVFMQYLW